MAKPKFKGLKGVIVILILAVMLVLYYHHLSNKNSGPTEEESESVISPVKIALQRNLNTNYPATPKEVVKYFGEITQCFYNETIADDDLEALARQIQLLYDDELVSYKSFTDYLFDLKSDITFYNTNGYRVTNVIPRASTDVFYFSEDGYEWARLYCIFTIKSGKYYKNVNDVFVLRKDEKSHWRIFGWKEVDEQQSNTGN